MQNDLLEKMRNSRGNRSVLKLRLINLRSRSPDYPLLVFEGDDDKIVYNRWLGRVNADMKYEAFVCKGKRAVSVVQDILRADAGNLSHRVYLFVDRDFDDAAKFVECDALFVTDRYSVENYLVESSVLSSLMRDEFPCNERPDLTEAVVSQYEIDYAKFLEITRDHNERLFKSIKLNVRLSEGLSDRVADYACVAVADMQPSTVNVDELIPSFSAVPQELDDRLREEFGSLDRRARYRGKNAYLFFSKWLSSLCDHFEQKTGPFQDATLPGRVRRNELTIGTFAAKSPLPLGFETFAAQIAA